ncbi:LRR receptor-like serine/threonine-protein kinase ERL2 isoform X2 [Camellia sinensis]|uniref:LRR receptor-like serine/threonine-protein kinase ERL2 isoform X2 n=1 Tax=Camellia sinensis TaxID=4442 RepID=UPI00103668BD|nr:LRR receptor-like serine/threonine-protein kinase ERL2 isoform X2 [Camellia sinensis]XP_028116274.1 LRR receptor-like serine/threonine-protein kinase ERL2 isoform X2 [Camellia sinensis]
MLEGDGRDKCMPLGEERIFDPSVRNLSNLNLGGEISPAIGDLKNLQFMDFQGNKLTGQIPDEIGNCVSLMLVGFFHGYSLITTLMFLTMHYVALLYRWS